MSDSVWNRTTHQVANPLLEVEVNFIINTSRQVFPCARDAIKNLAQSC